MRAKREEIEQINLIIIVNKQTIVQTGNNKHKLDKKVGRQPELPNQGLSQDISETVALSYASKPNTC